MMPPEIPDLEAERTRTLIVLPFPPASLSGHSDKHFWRVRPVIKQHREWACLAALGTPATLPEEGDISLHLHFVPPDRRGDRTNYWNRCKAYIDGIASGYGVNDSRFLPSMSFGAPEKPGRVEVTVG